ncbi:temptin-like [Saccostrea echinata]|uniref:temptin-like n=1 Tax=Saccostrea echinata TaxID=191078 RepID=UPI002A811464|nr:temptin-like [Saccostrea echinata]
MILTAVFGFLLVTVANALPQYRDRILNGHAVPNPCCPGSMWGRVGHMSSSSTQLNGFGRDFASSGHMFTEQLCLADSDGDGVRNGQELGLVTNRYTLQTLCSFLSQYNMNPRVLSFLRLRGILRNPSSHPGICDQRGQFSTCQPPPNCGC